MGSDVILSRVENIMGLYGRCDVLGDTNPISARALFTRDLLDVLKRLLYGWTVK